MPPPNSAVPMLSYEDVGAAIDWLTLAFGFEESGDRFSDDEGRVTHAELSLDGATVFLGWPGPDYRGPKRLAEQNERVARLLATPWVFDGVQVKVSDLDAHYERAREGGAEILREPEDQPFGRLYSAADLEGHRWMFMQPS
jgi:PhnB protein